MVSSGDFGADLFQLLPAAIHGEHLVLTDTAGKLVALFLFDIGESWNEI